MLGFGAEGKRRYVDTYRAGPFHHTYTVQGGSATWSYMGQDNISVL